jgi:hypothetical protein
LLAYRELDDALGLAELAGTVLSDGRRHGRSVSFKIASAARVPPGEACRDADRRAAFGIARRRGMLPGVTLLKRSAVSDHASGHLKHCILKCSGGRLVAWVTASYFYRRVCF